VNNKMNGLVGNILQTKFYACCCILLSGTRPCQVHAHGRRKFFQGGAVGDFPKIYSREAKSGEICFLPLEIEKITFFC